jgi:hypothetical protein
MTNVKHSNMATCIIFFKPAHVVVFLSFVYFTNIFIVGYAISGCHFLMVCIVIIIYKV